MTFYNTDLQYRVTLDTKLNLFIVFDKRCESFCDWNYDRASCTRIEKLHKEFIQMKDTDSY